MCGVGAILRVHASAALAPPHDHAIPESWLDLLEAAIAHRGPDGRGRFRDRALDSRGRVVDVALVHRRMSIIDLDGGAQPMLAHRGPPLPPHRRDGSRTFAGVPLPAGFAGPAHTPTRYLDLGEAPDLCAVTFNGCIYNHRALRTELATLKHDFNTDHSDTEVLLHGWRAWGPAMLDKLDGMYAFALWDRRTASLFIARDLFGERPLYIAADTARGIFVLASTPSVAAQIFAAAMGHPAPALDPAALRAWIAMGYHPTSTPFADVDLIAPGASAVLPCDDSEFASLLDPSRALVEPPRRLQLPKFNLHAWSMRSVQERLAASVALRLEADVPLACFLSGGIDSSLIASFASETLAARGSRLTTICVRMPEAGYDESPHAAAVAATLPVDHLTIDASATAADDLTSLIRTLGVPLGDSSLLPTHWACSAAADSVGVMLSGDGGDELFLGYDRYLATPWLHQLYVSSWILPTSRLARTHPKTRANRLARLLRAARYKSYAELLAIYQTDDRRRLMGPLGKAAVPPFPAQSAPHARDFDLVSHFPGDLLRKVDHAAMACPIEIRAPFLSRRLAEFARALPPRLVCHRKEAKGLLRAIALARGLPPSAIKRPKMGFAIPIDTWLRTDFGGLRSLLTQFIHAPSTFAPLANQGLELNLPFARRMLEEHLSGHAHHGQRLYVLLTLALWTQMLPSWNPPRPG